MYYEVPIKKLQKILPETVMWNDRGSIDTISKKDIAARISSGHVFMDDEGYEHVKIKAYGAYLSLNATNQREIVNINLGDETGLPEKLFEDWKSVAQWFALQYQDKENVVCNIEGNPKVISGLLGKWANPIENIKTHPISFTPKKLNWNISQETLAQSWGNEDFVIEKIKSTRDKYDEIFKFVPDNLWEKRDFVKNVLDAGYSTAEFLPTKVKKGDVLLSLISEDLTILAKNWSYFEKDFTWAIEKLDERKKSIKNKNDSELSFEAYRKTPLEHLDVLKSLHLNEEEKLSLNVVEKIFNTLLQSPETCKNILESTSFTRNSHDVSSLYRLFPLKSQMNPIVYNTLFHILDKDTYRSASPFLCLPPAMFEDKNTAITLIKDNLDLAFKSSSPLPHYIKTHFENDLAVATELLKQSKVVNYKSNNRHSDGRTFSNIKQNLSKKLIYTEEFFYKLIELKDDDIRPLENKFVEKMLNSPQVHQHILNHGHYSLFSKLDSQFIFKLDIEKDKKHIMAVVAANYHLLTQKDTPDSWRKDIDIVSKVAKDIRWLELSKTELKQLCQKPEDAFKLIDSDPSIFSNLPVNMRKNHDVAAYFLESLSESETKYYRDVLDPSLWATQDFCIKALEINTTFASKMPKDFWLDYEFIDKLFKKLDEREIDVDVLNYAPSEIKQYLDSFKMEPGQFAKFAQSFFAQQMLTEEFENKAQDIKPVKKIKI